MDALGMNISMSSMGLSSSQMGLTASALGMGSTGGLSHSGKLDEAERRHRLEQVLSRLNARTGRVSQEGLERLAKRLGLEPAWDIGDKVGDGKLLSFAGTTMVVDVEFLLRKPDSPCRVALQYHGLSDSVNDFAEAATAIMQNDLMPDPRTAPINVTLDRFAANLEHISRLDKLSVPGTSCFEAIDGVYRSLKRLYEHERNTALALLGDTASDESLETEVMCGKSGSPKMHVRRKVGLQLDYWRQRRLVPRRSARNSKAAPLAEDSMELDAQRSKLQETDPDPSLYSLVIEAENSLPALYPPIRSSSNWISERVQRPPDEAEPSLETMFTGTDRIDWQDPPAFGASADGSGTSSPTPQARFIARLSPPLPVPIRVAINLLHSVQADTTGQEMRWWHKVVLDRPEVMPPVPGSLVDYKLHVERKLSQQKHKTANYQSVMTSDQNSAGPLYEVELTIPPHCSAEALAVVELASIPFEHPKQIVAMLPILRQYAALSSFASCSLGTDDASTRILKETNPSAANDVFGSFDTDVPGSDPHMDLSFEDWMAEMSDDTHTEQRPTPNKVEMELRLDGLNGPRVSLHVPTKSVNVRVEVEVGLNGELQLSETNIYEDVARSLVKGLSIAEDAGVWAAWVAQKLG